MDHSVNRDKPLLAVLLGDATGIGPELVAKIYADGFLDEICDPILIGDRRVLESGMRVAGVDFLIQPITHPREARQNGAARLIDTVDLDPAAVPVGHISPVAGKAAIESLIRAVRLYQEGAIEAIVFAPLNKAAYKMAGYDYECEHYLLAELFGVHVPCGEMNVVEGIMTTRVTSHIPLEEVSARLTYDDIIGAIELLSSTLKRSGVTKPRIAVAALNPHCGESGLCGRQEIDIIAPAVAKAREAGVDAVGPISADVLFHKAFAGDYDGVVTMYHDQGQIALKVKGFEEGVTASGGIPVPVTTPAHGTAFDIAGKNLAKTTAIKNAARLAASMSVHSRR